MREGEIERKHTDGERETKTDKTIERQNKYRKRINAVIHGKRKKFSRETKISGAETGIYSGGCEILKRGNYTKQGKQKLYIKTIFLKKRA